MPRLRHLAARALSHVRRNRLAHAPLHRAAEAMAQTHWGARLITSVLEPDGLTVGDYARWIARNDTLSDADRSGIAAHIARMLARPLISVAMPVYATETKLLTAAIESVRAQLYPDWELCIADDASPSRKVWRLLES